MPAAARTLAAAAGGAAAVAPSSRTEALVRDIGALVAFPTISADPRRSGDMIRCAGWLARALDETGLAVEVLRGHGHPLVVARRRGPRRAPTVLLYAHYDVVPPGDAGSWRFPPFTMRRRGAYLVGRGTSDDKGPLACHLAALREALARGELPVHVVVLLDGEEEIGSPGLRRLLAGDARLFRCDAVLVSDTRMLGPGRPTIVTSQRGVVRASLDVRRDGGPLHAGAFGGVVPDPARELCRLIACLGPIGDIAGARVRRDPLAYAARRPALTVTRLASGGGESAISAGAHAELELRIPPGVSTSRAVGALRRRLDSVPIGRGLTPVLRVLATVPAFEARADGPVHRAADVALTKAFGRRPALVSSGGTVGAAAALASALRAPVVHMGFASPDDRMHGPNERVRIDSLLRGVDAVGIFLRRLPTELAHAR